MNYKSATILFSLIFLSIACLSQKQNSSSEGSSSEKNQVKKIDKIELTEKTRGTNRLITFSENTLTVNLNGNHKKSSLGSPEWKSINEEVASINLEKLATYESPTTDRYSDAALASEIIITVNGETYRSAEFDSGKPPVELKVIYSKLKESSRNFTQSPERTLITR